MKKNTAHRRGFTLLEFVVSVGLIAIFTAMGVVNFRYTSQKQKLLGTAARVRQIYVGAKANALSGKKNCRACGALAPSFACGVGDVALMGWEIILDAPNLTFQTRGVCGNGDDLLDPSVIRFTMDGLPAKIDTIVDATINTSGPALASRIVFKPSGGGMYPFFRDSDPPIVIRVSDTFGNAQAFTINGAGVIGPLYIP